MNGVHWREDTGWEGKCNDCATYWPLTHEFWYPRQGTARCRACVNERQRRGARRARASMIDLAAIRRSEELRYKREWARAKRARLIHNRKAQGVDNALVKGGHLMQRTDQTA